MAKANATLKKASTKPRKAVKPKSPKKSAAAPAKARPTVARAASRAKAPQKAKPGVSKSKTPPRMKARPAAPAPAAETKPSARIPSVVRSKGSEPITLHHRQVSAKEAAELRQLLVERRRQLISDVNSLEAEALNSDNRVSNNHLADTSGDQYEQDFTLQFIENETEELQAIQRAVDKLDGKLPVPYGRCESCSIWISVERLKAKPFARICIHCIERFEKEGGGEEFGIRPDRVF